MEYANIKTELLDSNLEITINRPEKLNAINKETISELAQAFRAAQENDEVKVVILTGSGEKAFIAGADISEFAHFSIAEGKRLAAEGQESLFDLVENLSKPVIAAVNGFALGGGLELAMACHVRIASSNAKMGLPEVSLGVIPGYGGTQRLSQLAGKGKAMEMILSAGMIDAQEAYRIGLVNQVVEQANLLEEARNMALKMKKNSPMAMAAAIRSLNAGFKNDVNGFDVEIDEFGKCFGTSDFKEGTSAFLEKRRANFSASK
jgi:enoyl-CoA hydratase